MSVVNSALWPAFLPADPSAFRELQQTETLGSFEGSKLEHPDVKLTPKQRVKTDQSGHPHPHPN